MFKDKLAQIIQKNDSLLCIGLDPMLEKLPSHIQKEEYPFFSFIKAIIDSTNDLVCCYKPNSAFYEAEGAKGIEQLKMICDYIKKNYTDIPILLDAKRADIDSTNEGYIKFAFGYLQADAITLHPYLGRNALSPFLELKDKGLFILCHTSNNGAEEFQELKVNNDELYKVVAKHVIKDYNGAENCFLVVGATYPRQLEEIRSIIGQNMFVLVPGIGAQGGDLESTLKAGLNSNKTGLIISSSRNIIYASSTTDFAETARGEALTLRNNINSLRTL